MAAYPAFCSYCDSFFHNTSVFGNFPMLTLRNVSVNCPYCGADAQFLDGTYITNIINVIINSGITQSDFEKFVQIVEDNKKNPKTVEEISQKIETEVSKLAPLKKFLTHNLTLATVLGLILSAMSAYFGFLNSSKPSQITPEKVQEEMAKPKTKPTPKARPKKKPNVNAPCICGSGKKYKKCCQSKSR